MRVRRFAILAVGLLCACTGTTGGPAGTPSTAPPAATSGHTPTAIGGGGVSISALLGEQRVPPASTIWTRVSDPTAPFTYEVPSTWSMHVANPWQQAGATIGVALAAGPDLAKLSTDFSVPGVVVGVSANQAGLTPRQAVAGDDFTSVCSASPVEDATEPGSVIAYQLWRSCAGGAGILLVLVIAPTDGRGIVGIVFQGTSEQDLGYLDHIVQSLAASTPTPPSAAPATGAGTGSGPTYTISMDTCHNQHGQGVSAGLIRNDDSLIHTYRIVVAFSDPNGVFLNDTAWTTSDLQPGVTATWQATVPSGLPAVSVGCQITAVQVVR